MLLVDISNSIHLMPKTGSTIWFTGLSYSGKSTLANTLHRALSKKGIPFSYFGWG
ncbi:MAG: adenylyl-sulfate kinase [Bacteroidetes bacterium]|nr:adenylyl-sulfate kinase [Bacteroidota bacterium]